MTDHELTEQKVDQIIGEIYERLLHLREIIDEDGYNLRPIERQALEMFSHEFKEHSESRPKYIKGNVVLFKKKEESPFYQEY